MLHLAVNQVTLSGRNTEVATSVFTFDALSLIIHEAYISSANPLIHECAIHAGLALGISSHLVAQIEVNVLGSGAVILTLRNHEEGSTSLYLS